MFYTLLNRIQLWFFLLICVGLLLLTTQKCVERYLKKETGVAVKFQSSTKAAFPEFTICPNFADSYREDVLRSHGTTTDLYRNMGRLPRQFDEGVDLKEFHRKASKNLAEVVFAVYVETTGVNNDNSHVRMFSGDVKREKVWSEHPLMIFGRCYSLTVPKELVELGITNVRFEFFGSPYIYIHHPGQFMDPDTKSKVAVTLGKMLFADIAYELTYLISSEDDDDHSSSSPACSSFMDFGFDRCLYEQSARVMFQRFGCTGPAMPKGDGFPTCDLSRFNQSSQDEFHTFQWNLRYNLSSICQPPCGSLTWVPGFPDVSDYSNKNMSYAKLYFKRNTKVTTHVYTYEMVSMLAEIGGYTGLLLGFSLFNVQQLVQMFIEGMEQRRFKCLTFKSVKTPKGLHV